MTLKRLITLLSGLKCVLQKAKFFVYYVVSAAVINLILLSVLSFQVCYYNSTDVCLSESKVDLLNYTCPVREFYHDD
jgi:hypothetical protein